VSPAGEGGSLLGLLGSGEFEEWAAEVDRWLLDRASTGDGSVLILPAASAPEGDEVFDRWAQMGLEHYTRTGVAAEVLPIKRRDDAEDPAFVDELDRASMVFFSGGNPAYLASILAGTPFWTRLLERMGEGFAYGGCSAGISCLGELAPDSASIGSQDMWRPGLKLFPRVVLGPHWDALNTYVPGLRDVFLASLPPGFRLLAVDERTAAVGGGTDWHVVGMGSVHLVSDGEWQDFPAGSEFQAQLTGGIADNALD
jgi:cyanophycinase